MPQNRSDQASVALAFRNHEARLRALEANPIVGNGGGSGIMFDTDNEGGWLDITTNDIDGSGYGMHLLDTTLTGGIRIEASGGGDVTVVTQDNLIQITDTSVTIQVEDNFYVQDNGADQTFLEIDATGSGAVKITPALTVLGLSGATADSRYVGATTSGSPASGTFAVGDYVVDQSGAIWVCTSAGSPGTWTEIGSSGSGISFDTSNLGGYFYLETTGAEQGIVFTIDETSDVFEVLDSGSNYLLYVSPSGNEAFLSPGPTGGAVYFIGGDAYLYGDGDTYWFQANSTGLTLGGLPSTPGPSGTLYSNLGIVTVSP